MKLMQDFLEFQQLMSIVQLFCLWPICRFFFFYFARAMVNRNNGVNIGGILA